ncbi:MAG: type II toxin-antitoxin system prevent-host-death family antitoxin [Trueperaceae bacterium]|nr:type II toxin-antitoxin system prevent-host-death family antitoxin [Trueperaceae bacterium]
MQTRTRKLQDAKARFSDIVRRAEEGEDTIVTRHGVATAVVMSIHRYRRFVQPRQSVLEALGDMPAMDDLPLERLDDMGRDTELP